jgi:hypothetical protein
MTKLNVRHHAAHPPSSARPNLDINKKPNLAPPEKAAMPTVNPSLGKVGVDAVNSRLGKLNMEDTDDEMDDECDPDDSDCDEDRLAPKHN